MQYTYRSKTYHLELNNAGKIVCNELDFAGDTTEDVRALIRKQVDAERSGKKISVVFFDGHWGNEYEQYFHGTTTGILDDRSPHKQAWLSWKDDGRNEREKRAAHQIYLDTPENIAKMDEIVALHKQADELKEKADKIVETLVSLKG